MGAESDSPGLSTRHQVTSQPHDTGGEPAGAAVGGRAWLLIRLTGLLLSVLVLGHLFAVHLLTDVAHTTSSFVLRRWSTAVWIGWDGCMLTTALAHGSAGLWMVVRDHTWPGRARRCAAVTIVVIALALAGLGWYTIAAVVHDTLAAR